MFVFFLFWFVCFGLFLPIGRGNVGKVATCEVMLVPCMLYCQIWNQLSLFQRDAEIYQRFLLVMPPGGSISTTSEQ